jgi:hypothetical protein
MARTESDDQRETRRKLAQAQSRQFPDPVLKTETKPVEVFDDELKALLLRMHEIGEDAIHHRHAEPRELLFEGGEGRVHEAQAGAEVGEPGAREGEGRGVPIEADHLGVRQREDRLRVPATPERAVDVQAPLPRRQGRDGLVEEHARVLGQRRIGRLGGVHGHDVDDVHLLAPVKGGTARRWRT